MANRSGDRCGILNDGHTGPVGSSDRTGHGDATHNAGTGVLALVLLLNLLVAVAQFIGGAIVGSLALIGDATHNLVDVVGLGLAWWATWIATKPPSSTHTFGRRRAGVLAAGVSGLLLVGSALVIGAEAIRRIGDAPDLNGWPVLILALVGLTVNSYGAAALHKGHQDALARRAAVLHLLTDAAASAVVVVVGATIILTGVHLVDPIASLAISIVVMAGSVALLRSVARILTDAVPVGLDVRLVTATLNADADVESIHHLHVWSLNESDVALSAHVVVETADTLHNAQLLTERLAEELSSRHGITHATLQVECHGCDAEVHTSQP